MSKHGYAPRAVRNWLLACALGCVPVAEGVALADEAPPAADDCVSAKSQVGNKRIDVQIQNGCEAKFSCSLKYVVRCSTNDGHQTSLAKREEAFRLGRKGKHELSLSADECQQSWDIDKIEWACLQ